MAEVRGPVVAVAAVLLALAGCSGDVGQVSTVRLVDRFQPEAVQGAPLEVSQPPPLESWEFEQPPEETPGWSAADGVAAVRIDSGALRGRSSSDWPLLTVQRSHGLEDDDYVYSLEIRLRVSAGSNLSVALLRELPPPHALADMAFSFPWWESVPILAGDTLQTYQVRFGIERSSSEVQHLLLRPTDAAGADFEIDWVRLVSRRQHLARIPSGVGWHGFGDVFKESLVSRTPESIRFLLQLPERPWLDLQVGTVDFPPVTFQVRVRPAGDSSPPRPLLNRTVTTPHRWEEASVDLSALAGRQVELELTLAADEPGSLGFWGTAVVRHSGPPPSTGPAPLLETASEPPQGVIVIVADTLRPDHLDGYGYRRKTAPLIAELAAQGARFEHSLVQATWTKVSVPAIATSMYPTSHRVADFTDRLSAAATTLAEVYRQAGYATVAYSSVPFTGKFTNLHQGYEELHESSSLSHQGSSKTAREFVDRLGQWLARHRDGPFFAFLHVFDPHDPYEPDRPWNTLYADPARRDEHKQTEEKLRESISDPLLRLFKMPTRAELVAGGVDPESFVAHTLDWYDGSIRGLDVEVARLMGHLQDLGLDEKTLVVFTSDHGEEFLEHGRSFHGQSAYGELSRVPLILYQPALIPAGLEIGEVVQSLDLMPTLLELSRLPVPEQAMGQSLLPLLEAARRSKQQGVDPLEVARALGWERRPAITEKAATGGSAAPPPRDTESYALVWDGWKLVHHTRRPDGAPEFELFEFATDPFDQRDRAAEQPERVRQLADRLEQWRQAALEARLPETAPTEGLSKEELDRLRSLGYIQ